jgi:hypothetical protein
MTRFGKWMARTLSAVLCIALGTALAQDKRPAKKPDVQKAGEVFTPIFQGGVKLLPMVDPDGSYAVGVQVVGTTPPLKISENGGPLLPLVGDEQVVVRVFYHAKVNGLATPLLLSKVFVVPATDGAWSMTDSVPTTKGNVVRVEATVVKTIETQRFEVGK